MGWPTSLLLAPLACGWAALLRPAFRSTAFRLPVSQVFRLSSVCCPLSCPVLPLRPSRNFGCGLLAVFRSIAVLLLSQHFRNVAIASAYFV